MSLFRGCRISLSLFCVRFPGINDPALSNGLENQKNVRISQNVYVCLYLLSLDETHQKVKEKKLHESKIYENRNLPNNTIVPELLPRLLGQTLHCFLPSMSNLSVRLSNLSSHSVGRLLTVANLGYESDGIMPYLMSLFFLTPITPAELIQYAIVN
jgi:hypothetical protein